MLKLFAKTVETKINKICIDLHCKIKVSQSGKQNFCKAGPVEYRGSLASAHAT